MSLISRCFLFPMSSQLLTDKSDLVTVGLGNKISVSILSVNGLRKCEIRVTRLETSVAQPILTTA